MAKTRTEAKPATATATKLPKFGLDKGQYAVLVLGRRFDVDLTLKAVKKAHALTERHRKESGLPLVFVSPGSVECEEDEMASERFFAGLHVAHAQDQKKPAVIDAAMLTTEALATIPAAFFRDLEALFAKSGDGDDEEEDEEDEEGEEDHRDADGEEDDDEDEGPSTGLFLAPANWAVAQIHVGDVDSEPVKTTSSEDTSIGQYLSPELLTRLRGEKKKVLLKGFYC